MLSKVSTTSGVAQFQNETSPVLEKSVTKCTGLHKRQQLMRGMVGTIEPIPIRKDGTLFNKLTLHSPSSAKWNVAKACQGSQDTIIVQDRNDTSQGIKLGDRVRVLGVLDAVKRRYNGSQGKVTRYLATRAEWGVTLDNCEKIGFKEENLVRIDGNTSARNPLCHAEGRWQTYGKVADVWDIGRRMADVWDAADGKTWVYSLCETGGSKTELISKEDSISKLDSTDYADLQAATLPKAATTSKDYATANSSQDVVQKATDEDDWCTDDFAPSKNSTGSSFCEVSRIESPDIVKTVTGDFNLVGERPASPSKTEVMTNTDQAQDAVTTDTQSQQEFAVGDRVRCRYIGRDWKYGVVTELEPLRVLADRFDRDWVWDEVEKVSSSATFSPRLLRLDSDECEISKHHTVDYQWCGRLDSEECEIGKCNANDYSDYHTSDSDWTNEYQTQDPDDQAEFRVGVTVADADGCIGVVEKVDMTDPAGKFYKVQWSRHGAHHGAAGYYDSSSLRKLQVQDTLEVVKNIHDQRPQIRRGATCEILDVSRSNGDIRVHVDGKDFPCWIKNKNMTRVRLVNRAR